MIPENSLRFRYWRWRVSKWANKWIKTGKRPEDISLLMKTFKRTDNLLIEGKVRDIPTGSFNMTIHWREQINGKDMWVYDKYIYHIHNSKQLTLIRESYRHGQFPYDWKKKKK